MTKACEICLERKSAWKCVDCKTLLCDKCKVHHPRFPSFRGHRIVELGDEGDTEIDRLVFCEKHTEQLIIRNCQECEELLCHTCRETAHEFHKTETIEQALERVLPELHIHCEKIKQLIADIDKNRNELETRKAEVKAAFEKCRQDAEIQLQKIIDRATEDYNCLVKQLDIKEEEEVDKIRLDRQKEYEQVVEWMNTCTESAKGVTLMREIQTSLEKRLKELAEIPL